MFRLGPKKSQELYEHFVNLTSTPFATVWVSQGVSYTIEEAKGYTLHLTGLSTSLPRLKEKRTVLRIYYEGFEICEITFPEHLEANQLYRNLVERLDAKNDNKHDAAEFRLCSQLRLKVVGYNDKLGRAEIED